MCRLRAPFRAARAVRGLLVVGLLLGSATTTGACGGRQRGAELSYTEAAEALFAAAEATYARRDYEGARVRYSQVYQEYPYSQFATLSEMRVADCYFEERSYELARVSYERFVQFHPTHEEVPRAAYQVAMTYVRQLPREFFLMPPGHDRDLTQARNAYTALGSFLRVYGDSEFVPEVMEHLARVTDLLTAHEVYVGRWYLRHGNPMGAARRGRFVVDTYPDADAVPDALFLFAQSMLELGDLDQAGGALQRLAQEFPDSEAGLAAAEYLQQLSR
jgi:outer membrane protein assembly factor BamD